MYMRRMDIFNKKQDEGMPHKEGMGGGQKEKRPSFFNNIIGTVLIFVLMVSLYSFIVENNSKTESIPFSQLAHDITLGNVVSIMVKGEDLAISYTDGAEKKSQKEAGTALTDTLANYGVTKEQLGTLSIEIKNPGGAGFWLLNLAPIFIPILLVIFIVWFLSRQVRGAGMQAFSFGQSKARFIDPNDKSQLVLFADVAGVKEAKEELLEIVDFLKQPKKFLDIGARIPKGVLLMGAPGTGKCVTGDTHLVTNKGIIALDEVPKYFSVEKDGRVEGLEVVSVTSPELSLRLVRASHWYHLGEQKTRRITTELGACVEGTLEHPVVTVDEKSGNFLFKRLDEIKEQDWVVIGYDTNAFGTYTKIPNEDVAYLLGVLTGDGCLTIRNRVVFSTADEEVLTRVQEIAQKFFGKKFIQTQSRKYDYELRSIKAKALVREWGLTETYAEGKRIPEWIRIAPKSFLVAYLRGLFDTDGYVERQGAVGFSSASVALIHDVHVALLNLGIVNRLYERKKIQNGKLQFYITVYGDFIERFQSEIGFTIKRKHLTLAALCIRQRNTNVNLIPCQQNIIRSIWEETVATTSRQLNREFYGESLYKNTKRYMSGERSPSIAGMATFVRGVVELAPQVVTLPEIAYLKQLASGKFFFTRVKSISNGKADVYDLTVPHTHNFIANGFINHNTLLARAVAGEAGVPFFSISGSEFVEMFVGVGASRVRDLFKMAKRAAPAIIFIDEIDAVGRVRGTGVGGGNDEREQTLNQILVEMDGFEPTEKVIVMAASNRPDVLDPALLRPGRFDRRVVLDLPDREDREAILAIHARKKPLAEDVNIRTIAERTPGFSGADLYSLMNEGAILAARENRKKVSQFDLIRSIEKVMLGPERKSHLLSKKEKEIVSYHEAGHALVASVLPYADPVHKVTIISRAHAGGYTLKLPLEERRLQSRKEFLDDIAVAMGGFVAEKLLFDDITTGPANDLAVAT
ncbi:MAG: cell division protease FtsH, partial [Parcubacteria group bacterium Gr01-1014_48]